jgi:hypothetical protein
VTTVERTFLDERPSALAAACAPSVVAPAAHAYVVGQKPVAVRLRGVQVGEDGWTMSGFGFIRSDSTIGISKINYRNTGTASAKGEGMATSLRDQSVSVLRDQKVAAARSQNVRGDEVRGVPPRGRPV